MNPDESVAHGAALLAGCLDPESGEFRKPIVNDICPHPIGIEIPGDEMDVFIKKGMHVPCEVTKQYMTLADN